MKLPLSRSPFASFRTKAADTPATPPPKEEEIDAAEREVRARERGRVHAIMSSDVGRKFPDAARDLALNTSAPRGVAIRILTSVAHQLKRDALGGLAQRMAAVHVPDIGPGGGDYSPDGPGALAAGIIAAGKKARGE